MNADEIQARVRLAALLFQTAMPRLAKVLPSPPRAEEKERLYAGIERAAWEMDARVLDGAHDDETAWEEKVLADAAVAARLSSLVDDVVKARAGRP